MIRLIAWLIGWLINSSRKILLPRQASSEQADVQSRPEVSREMLRIHCHAWTCLSIVMLECSSSAKRFLSKTVNEKKFLSSQSLTFILTDNQLKLLKLTNTIKKTEQHFYSKTKTNKYTGRLRYIMNTWRTLLKFKNTKKTLKYKVTMNKQKTDKDKNNQMHSQNKIHNEHLKAINKICNYKNLNIMEHKTDTNILLMTDTKKLNSSSMTEHKTGVNISKFCVILSLFSQVCIFFTLFYIIFCEFFSLVCDLLSFFS